jgi:hypothetical protein
MRLDLQLEPYGLCPDEQKPPILEGLVQKMVKGVIFYCLSLRQGARYLRCFGGWSSLVSL